MTNLFTYTKTEGRGWLVEKSSWNKKPDDDEEDEVFGMKKINAYNEHIANLRRFKYDYPDPGKEMELGKDFEVKNVMTGQRVVKYGGIPSHVETYSEDVAIPITQRTYSEQDLLDVWNPQRKNDEYDKFKTENNL